MEMMNIIKEINFYSNIAKKRELTGAEKNEREAFLAPEIKNR